jgi:hypothetical protein
MPVQLQKFAREAKNASQFLIPATEVAIPRKDDAVKHDDDKRAAPTIERAICQEWIFVEGRGYRRCGQPVGADGEHCPEHAEKRGVWPAAGN